LQKKEAGSAYFFIMSIIYLYGIPNCDTVKKTAIWLAANKVEVTFHNYKTEGIDKKKLTTWCKKVGWQIILNKKSTTWKSLAADVQKNITNQAAAIQLMMEHTSLIKRPIIEVNDTLIVGFNEQILSKQFT
jgi:Spx/MgsR family transcriptional regulator